MKLVRWGMVLSVSLAALGAVRTRAAQPLWMPAAASRAVSNLAAVDRVAASQEIGFAIALPLRNREGLTNLLRDLYDPASPRFHQFLTPDEFARQFGPTPEDYETVAAYARSNGLAVAGRHPNRLLLDVSGAAGNIEKSLHVRLNHYAHPTENRDFFAPDVRPSLDLNVPILGISGLDNYSLPKPRVQRQSWANAPAAAPRAGAGPGGSYRGSDFRAAYAPDTQLTGAGQKVGLLQFDGYNATDISYYETAAGLPSVSLTNVLLDGFTGAPTGSGGEVEVSLDIEMSISMAPGLSQVIVYEAGPSGNWHDILNRMATDNLAQQLSCSWYIPGGPSDPVADQIFQQMAAQGQSFFNASGDDNAYSGLIDFPGDTPYITQVGGTTLSTTGPGGQYVSETVWNRGNGVGSGGGISTQYAIPAWQATVSMAANFGSTNMRNIPDVALTAENVYVRADGVDQTVGGTSCAAPLWAGFTALVNQQAAQGGHAPLGFANPALYALGQGAKYSAAFHDTTNGNNGSSTHFPAVAGFDLATGWGTPTGQRLIDALEPLVIIKLPASVTEGAGLLPVAGQIQLPAPATNAVGFTLASSDPLVQVPSSVLVAAGQSNQAFDVTVGDDLLLNGTRNIVITATASNGLGSFTGSMQLIDNETATLSVASPLTAREGDPPLTATLGVSAPPAANVQVALSSSDTNSLTVPAFVTIPAGQTSAPFNVNIVDNAFIDGYHNATITAHVANWTDGAATLLIQDNEGTNLTVSLPSSAIENQGVLTNAGQVSVPGIVLTNLTVSLSSANSNKLVVPATVVILAGQSNAAFNLTLVDNSVADGHQYVSVTASAANFAPGSASLFVIDDESPPPPSNPRPPDLAVNIPANTSLGWDNGTSSEAVTNGGFETGSLAGWTQFNAAFSSFAINNGTYDPPSPDGPLPPFSGTYSTVGSEVGPGIFYLYQDVTIPTGATQALFSWAHRVRNFYSSFNSSQQFQVRVCDTNNNVLATAFSTSATDPLLGDWVQTNFDLSPYIGRTVRLMFWVNPGSYYLDVHLDAISVKAGTVEAGVTNDVYFGTNPTPGPAEFQGNTTNTAWALPLLAPQTTYYWQVVARKVGVGAGPIWRFTTAGLDHFEWSSIASPEGSNIPFPAGITAKDAFNQVVSNFTGQAGLTAVGGIVDTNVEDFESGVWPHAPWVSVAGAVLGTVSGAYAHDGNYGLSDPEWIYRTDVSVGKAGESLSVWFRPGSSGRAYLGFAANSAGCLSVVAAQNTGQFMIQQNTGYGFSPLVTNNQTWQVGKWYRMEVQFTSASSVTCNLYDSNGVTLLNSLSASNLTGLPGGVALRSFGVFSLDTLRSSAATHIPVAPTYTGSFAGGTWNGQVAVLQAGNGITLVADDGNQHTGRSNPFDVSLANDIAISIVNSPGPVGAGSNLTYTVTVTNIGPQDATDVVVTNRLPPNAFFVSAGTSQGTWDQNGNVVTASLGTIPGGTNATLSILVVPAVGGSVLTNIATVTRGEPDPSPGNNSATNIVVVAPALSIADASVTEGNVGTTNLVFTVTLTPAISQTVSVNYATADGTAMAGSDYVATNGILTFPAGITSRTITVAVKGDTLIEPDESFFVNLSNPINGVLARATATGTIVNDDGLPGQIDHLVWAAIPSTEYSGIPFPATVTALDASNNVATNFTGSVWLSAVGAHGGLAVAPTNTGSFVAGQWTGPLALTGNDSNVVLTASDANGHAGSSLAFSLLGPGSAFIPAPNRVDMVHDPVRNLLYITGSNQVLRYNLSTGQFLTPFTVGTNLWGIDISPDNNTLIVADNVNLIPNVWVYVIDLTTGISRKASFALTSSELGTYAVAFGNDGAAMITSAGNSSLRGPLRRYDPIAGTASIISPRENNSVTAASGDGRLIAIGEADWLDEYNVATQGITLTNHGQWWSYEAGVNRDASQFAAITPNGAYIYDASLSQIGLVGSSVDGVPIGVAYHPQADLVFLPWYPTSFVRMYDTHTLAEVMRYDCSNTFSFPSGPFQQGRVRASRDGANVFVTVSGGVRWISRLITPPTDLALSLSGPTNVQAGTNLTYTLTVTNLGTNPAADPRVFDRLPNGFAFISAASSQGVCTQSNGLVTCTLNPMSNGAVATINIVVAPGYGGAFTNVASVYSSASDTNPANNWASLATTVHSGALQVVSGSNFISMGPPGGPFTPTQQTYTLTNIGDGVLNWTAAASVNWAAPSVSTGVLAPGASTNVQIALNYSVSTSLPRGAYPGLVIFSNAVPNGFGGVNYNANLLVDNPPVVTPQTVAMTEDGSQIITLQGTDPDSDPITYSIAALPAHGTLYQTDGTNRNAVISQVPTPIANHSNVVMLVLNQHGYGSGFGTFAFTVNDGLLDSAPAAVTVNVTHVNHAPVAANDTVSFLPGASNVAFNVLLNDADPDGDPLTLQSFSTPALGTLVQITNGQFSYQPGAGFTNGQDTFGYTINDGHGLTSSAQVTIKAIRGYLTGGDWTTFGNGPSHTGYYPGALAGAMFLASWTSSNYFPAPNPVVAVGSNVYFTLSDYSSNSMVAALNASNGQPVWQQHFTSSWSVNPPTYANGRIYLQRIDASESAALWCVSATNGSVIWSAPHGAQWYSYYAPTVVSNGVWVAGGSFGGMLGFDTNGTRRFFYNGLPQVDQWTPTWYQSVVYSWVAGVFQAHDPLLGNVLWQTNLNWAASPSSMYTVSAIDAGRAFVVQGGNSSGGLGAIDLASHSLVWSIPGGIIGTPAVANGIVYAISNDTVFAFSAQTGATLGTYQATNDLLQTWQPIVTDDALIVSSFANTYVFDLPSRQLLQSIPTGGKPVLANGNLYIAGVDGAIHAYRTAFVQPAGIVLPPTRLPGGGFSLQLSGVPGRWYRLERADTLDGPWIFIGFLIADSNGNATCTDNFAPGAKEFYRAVYP